MREFYEYDDPNWRMNELLERDEEKEPRPRFSLPPRRKQFRYWSGLMFRPARDDFSSREIVPRIESPRVHARAKRGGRYQPADVAADCHNVPSHVDARAKRVVNNSAIVDGKKALRSDVGSAQRCAILRREA